MLLKRLAESNGFNLSELETFVEVESGLEFRYGRAGINIDDADAESLVQMFSDYLQSIGPHTTADEEESKADSDSELLRYKEDYSHFSLASGKDLPYVVLQVTLKEKFFGTGSGNLEDLEQVINHYAAKGYRLHTMATSNGGSKGGFGGDRIQATLVFEKKDF